MSNIVPMELTKSTLQEAQEILFGDRMAAYGLPTKSFERIGNLASLLCEKKISAIDVCWVLLAVKLSREVNKHKRDNLVDLAAYAELMNQLQDDDLKI